MNLKLHRKRKIEATIDMTPMLDTLLQVHIAFMFLMSFAASAVRIDLPQSAPSENKPSFPIVISLSADNQMYLNDQVIGMNDLPERLAPHFEKSGKREVILRGDQSLAYKNILEAFQAISRAGATQIHLAYENEKRP